MARQLPMSGAPDWAFRTTFDQALTTRLQSRFHADGGRRGVVARGTIVGPSRVFSAYDPADEEPDRTTQ